MTNEFNFKPYSSFQSNKLNFVLPKQRLQRYHHCVVVGGIVRSDPSNLLVNLNNCIWRKVILLTFDVIWTQSVMNKKQWARWSPECHPGILWNPIKSAQRWSFLTTPVGVVCSMAWIQWAVMAMKDTWFGSVHASVVQDIFPTDF